MLKVTIANIDSTFIGVFPTDNWDEAANLAIEQCIEHHGFMTSNYAYRNLIPGNNTRYGVVLLPSQDKDEYTIEHETTFDIDIEEFVTGTMAEY